MTLRTKLVVSFAGVILLALGLAGVAAVALRWQAEQQATLDRLAVVSPQLSFDLFRLQRQGATQEQITEFVRDAARSQGVRVLLVSRDGSVTIDSGETLKGKRLEIPPNGGMHPAGLYRSWTGKAGGQEDLVFVSARPATDRRGAGAGGEAARRFVPLPELSESVVVAVPRQTVTRAWLGLLPGLAWAGFIALAISVVVALLVARSIARPLLALTHASEEMARGNYDQEIPPRRRDEVGRLAAAFNMMARQVGRSHVQMRSLVANVSHDLKTPLTSILGFSQALRDGDVEGEQARETAGIIHEEAVRVRALVDDLLYLSEIDAQQLVLSRAPLDLGVFAARAVRRFEPSMRERGITITAAASPADLTVEGDSAKLERVLDNLLDNARKYTPVGGSVAVTVEAEAGAPSQVRLSIFNSGARIPADELPRLFERFYRLDRARGRTAGSGLGLAIARDLVELHGGTLTATSDQRGTTFTLTLPALTPTPTASPRLAEQPPAATPEARTA